MIFNHLWKLTYFFFQIYASDDTVSSFHTTWHCQLQEYGLMVAHGLYMMWLMYYIKVVCVYYVLCYLFSQGISPWKQYEPVELSRCIIQLVVRKEGKRCIKVTVKLHIYVPKLCFVHNLHNPFLNLVNFPTVSDFSSCKRCVISF
jgi:hypothetical protein